MTFTAFTQSYRRLPKMLTVLNLALVASLFLASVPARAAQTTPNPAANKTFLFNLYQDLLDRQPSPRELPAMLNFLNAGGSRATAATAMVTSTEYRQKFVQGLYRTYLNRQPSASEINFFVNSLKTGSNERAIIAILVGSTEYFQVRGGNTNAGFLGSLYRDLLNRPIDLGSLDYFGRLLTNGATPAQIATSILNSSEYRTVAVQKLYSKYLRRQPNTVELNFHVSVLAEGSEAQILIGLLSSDEYYLIGLLRSSELNFSRTGADDGIVDVNDEPRTDGESSNR